YGLRPKTLTPDARAAVLAHRWPGNIRELANVMERAALLTETPLVTADAVGLSTPEERAGSGQEPPTRKAPSRGGTGTMEREQILDARRETDWNAAGTATRLGIPRGTLRYHLKKLGLELHGSPLSRLRPAVAPSMPEPVPLPIGPARTASSWEWRQLAFLRASLVPASDRDARIEIGTTPQILVEKIESFGGRVEVFGPLSLVAAFGLEPVEDA